jgi:hypothetical protein
MAKRHALHTFILANRIYRDATVTAYVANADGAATAVLATLYDALTGTDELENPIQLDGEGKFDQAVYTEDSVVLEVSGLHITTHQTGVITPGGQWRGDYAGSTLYQSGDFIRQGDGGIPATLGNIYQAVNTFTSSTFAADVADPLKLALVIDYQSLLATVVPDATETVEGKGELATYAEAQAGTDNTNKFINPAKLGQFIKAGSSIASAATLVKPADASLGGAHDLTGTTNITNFWAETTSRTWRFRYTGTGLTMSHGVNLLLIGSKNITLQTGDTFVMRSNGSGIWLMVSFTRASGIPLESKAAINLLANMNSGFEVWQRGAGGAASIAVAASSNPYTTDRWYLGAGPNEAATVSQQAGLEDGSEFAARVQRNAGQTGTTSMFFGCPFDTDEVVRMRGKLVSLRFVARAGANWSPASGNLAFGFRVGTGTPAKRSTAVYANETVIFNNAVALTPGGAAVVHRVTATIAIPANATVGEFFFIPTPVGTAGANDWYEVDNVSLVEAPYVDSYIPKPFEDELRACMRHFQKSFDYDIAPAQNTADFGGVFRWRAHVAAAVAQSSPRLHLAPYMRVIPTITTFNLEAANAQIRNFTDGTDATLSAVGAVDPKGFVIDFTGTAGTAVNEVWGVHWTADAGI